jgi:hypothetical protein
LIDKVKNFSNKVVSAIKDKVKSAKDEQKQNIRLKDWQDKLSLALSEATLTLRDEREAIYLGTHDVDKNINSKKGPSKKSNNVVNLVLEFIETNVDATIPQPSVRTKLPGYEAQASMIEDSLTSDITELGITAINDVNERITPVQGFSAMLVGWNPDFKHHLYRGELTIESIHPKRIIPQPGVFELQKMDYFFILSSVTKSFIKKRYDVDLGNETEQFPELNYLDGKSGQPNNPDMVTEIVCWYKNEDGEVSKFVWCDNEVLEDLPDFFARRIEGKIEEYETLASEITLASGEVLPVGTEVPYFKPTRYPLIVRENIPLNFSFGGQSDVDVIRDQQDAYKKVVSTIEEKIMRGSAIVTALEGHRFDLSNELYKVIRGSQAELNALGVKTLQADISNDLAFAQQQYKAAQSTLGITNTFQGKADSTAVSGVAKQIQVNQSSGRLRSKEANKYVAFKELYEIMFEFKLAFYDELRPYVTKDANGQDNYGDFNKYAFLVRDKAGDLYYNTDFVFNADAGAGLPRDKMWLFSQATEMLKYGAYNPTPAATAFWTQMVAQKYPGAKAILDGITQQMQTASQNPVDMPKITVSYKDLMPDAQSQILQKIGIKSQGGRPDQMGQVIPMPRQPQPQQQQMPSRPQGQPTGGQQPQGGANPQDQVRQVLQQAMANMTQEEQQQFMAMPDEAKIQFIQQLIQGGGQGGEM